MKNNKGFTLIELLAVILVLGVIALIAIPSVMDIVEEARLESVEQYNIDLLSYSADKIPAGQSTGCMKWYVYSEASEQGKANMILDHNLTYADVRSANDVEIFLDTIKNYIDSWLGVEKIVSNHVESYFGLRYYGLSESDIPTLKSRSITYNEIAEIAVMSVALWHRTWSGMMFMYHII